MLPFYFIYSPLVLYLRNANLMILTEIPGHRAVVLPLQPNLSFHENLNVSNIVHLIFKISLFQKTKPSVPSPSSYPSSVVFAF